MSGPTKRVCATATAGAASSVPRGTTMVWPLLETHPICRCTKGAGNTVTAPLLHDELQANECAEPGGVVVYELYQETWESPANEGNSLDWFGLGGSDMGHPIRDVLRCLKFDQPTTVTCFGARVPSPERSGLVAKVQAQGITGGNCAC